MKTGVRDSAACAQTGVFLVLLLPFFRRRPRWLTVHGCPADLECTVREKNRPMQIGAGLSWCGLHAFRRGLATILQELGVADIVIGAILRHSDSGVARRARIRNDAVDPRSLAALEALESAVCNQYATGPADDETAGAVD